MGAQRISHFWAGLPAPLARTAPLAGLASSAPSLWSSSAMANMYPELACKRHKELPGDLHHRRQHPIRSSCPKKNPRDLHQQQEQPSSAPAASTSALSLLHQPPPSIPKATGCGCQQTSLPYLPDLPAPYPEAALPDLAHLGNLPCNFLFRRPFCLPAPSSSPAHPDPHPHPPQPDFTLTQPSSPAAATTAVTPAGSNMIAVAASPAEFCWPRQTPQMVTVPVLAIQASDITGSGGALFSSAYSLAVLGVVSRHQWDGILTELTACVDQHAPPAWLYAMLFPVHCLALPMMVAKWQGFRRELEATCAGISRMYRGVNLRVVETLNNTLEVELEVSVL